MSDEAARKIVRIITSLPDESEYMVYLKAQALDQITEVVQAEVLRRLHDKPYAKVGDAS